VAQRTQIVRQEEARSLGTELQTLSSVVTLNQQKLSVSYHGRREEDCSLPA